MDESAISSVLGRAEYVDGEAYPKEGMLYLNCYPNINYARNVLEA